MNVKELREALAELPGDMMVSVLGYERGVDEVRQVKPIEVALNYGPNLQLPEVYAPHEPIDSGYAEDYVGYQRATVALLTAET